MRASLVVTLRAILLLSIPATVGMIALRFPLIRFLYEEGEFTAYSTQLVAWALLWYTAGLVGHCLVEILARSFYALQDTKTPVLIGAVAMGLNVLLSFAFPALFTRLGWAPHGGLALANSLATALEATSLLVMMRRRLSGLGGRQVFAGVLQAAAGSLAMGVMLWGWLTWMKEQAPWLAALGGAALGALVYGMAALALRVPEVHYILARARRFAARKARL
jgi:putative peptidoglycan lipid II flippase